MTARTQSDRIFDKLRADILSCRVAPGSKLRINEIADALDVSLYAVREALSRLSGEGLVISESQKGYRVTPVSTKDLWDLTEARVEIERICLTRSVASGDLEWETDLVAAWHRLSKIPQPLPEDPNVKVDRWAAAHAEFHLTLVAACGSNKLLEFRSQLYQQAERYRRYSGVVDHDRNVLAEHQAIFDASIARDVAGAVQLMEAHLRFTAEIVISSLALHKEDVARLEEAV
jgi:DNA-binding GntR family transcriptional regulator